MHVSSIRLALVAALAAFAALPAAGCRSPQEYRLDADAEVSHILAQRLAAFRADPAEFGIERPPDALRERLIAGEELAIDVSLVRVLEIAAENSREFQARREDLYLVALDLTEERFRFDVRETGSVAAFVDGTGFEADTATGSANLGLSRLLGTGALIVGNIGASLFRFVSTGDAWEATSDLSLSVTQPLLRGFGSRITTETLTQAERDVIYQVRSYERFRRTFAFDVADRYFRILAQEDTLANEIANAERLVLLRQRNEAIAEAGQLSEIEVDQARQDELRAENRVVVARQGLEALLDDFKFFLGLPVDANLALDRAELIELQEQGLAFVRLAEDDVVSFALRHRLDYQTVLDRLDDARRRIAIAADALRPGLGVGIAASSSSEPDQPLDHDIDRVLWTATINLDLPLERLPERNAFRAALIGLDAAQRAAESLADGIRADLRDALRNLASLRESYGIQQNAVLLAERRVESTQLSLDAGRAQTRDLLEAQEALVQAQNAAVRALVDYHLAALALYRDMEALRVDATGLAPESVPFENLPDPLDVPADEDENP